MARRLAYELYSNALGTVYSHAVFGTLFVALFYAKVELWPLLLWAGLLGMNVAVRLRFILGWLRASDIQRQRPYMRRMALVTSLVNGVLWASTVFFLDFAALPFESLAASLMVFGLAAGAAVHAAYFLPAFYLSVVPYLGSYIFFHLFNMTFESLVIATILAVFGLMLYQQALQLNRTHKRNVLQKMENEWLIEKLKSANHLLEKASYTDFLTGSYNRRFFDLSLRQIWREQATRQSPLCLIMADIDHFKQLNDQFGHPLGDKVLKTVAELIDKVIRPTDMLFRYGGEEFVVVLPQTSLEEGVEVAERLRRTLAEHDFKDVDGVHRITLSFGVSAVVPDAAQDDSYLTLLKQADEQLYKSKQAGRNRVSFLC